MSKLVLHALRAHKDVTDTFRLEPQKDYINDVEDSLTKGRMSVFELQVAAAVAHEQACDKLWLRNKMIGVQRLLRKWEVDTGSAVPQIVAVYRNALKA